MNKYIEQKLAQKNTFIVSRNGTLDLKATIKPVVREKMVRAFNYLDYCFVNGRRP